MSVIKYDREKYYFCPVEPVHHYIKSHHMSLKSISLYVVDMISYTYVLAKEYFFGIVMVDITFRSLYHNANSIFLCSRLGYRLFWSSINLNKGFHWRSTDVHVFFHIEDKTGFVILVLDVIFFVELCRKHNTSILREHFLHCKCPCW